MTDDDWAEQTERGVAATGDDECDDLRAQLAAALAPPEGWESVAALQAAGWSPDGPDPTQAGPTPPGDPAVAAWVADFGRLADALGIALTEWQRSVLRMATAVNRVVTVHREGFVIKVRVPEPLPTTEETRRLARLRRMRHLYRQRRR